MQLRTAATTLFSLIPLLSSMAITSSVADEGTVSVRGAYYKERATRVTQPMVDAELEAGENGLVNGHFLIDSITSASVAAGAADEAFTETRYEIGGQYSHQLGNLRLGGGGRVSYEPDYTSLFAVLQAQLEVADKNATIGAAFARGRDAISNAGTQSEMAEEITGDLSTTLASLSFSQILSPAVIASATYDLTYLSGFQENVYRTVPAGGVFAPERVPDTRIRNAIAANVRAFVERTKTTAILGYRLYFDDWGIVGHTPEARIVQELGPELLVTVRYRFYKQSQAEFYKEIYNSADPEMEPFITSDLKLANQRTQIFGGKIDGPLSVLGVTGRLRDVRLSTLFEYTTQTTAFGNAIAAQFAFTVPFEY